MRGLHRIFNNDVICEKAFMDIADTLGIFFNLYQVNETITRLYKSPLVGRKKEATTYFRIFAYPMKALAIVETPQSVHCTHSTP